VSLRDESVNGGGEALWRSNVLLSRRVGFDSLHPHYKPKAVGSSPTRPIRLTVNLPRSSIG
jgi:hypothetical protein